MISVSQLAASVLFETLRESNVQISQSLRLVKEKEGFTLQLDIPTNADRVIRYEGAVVLIIDKELEEEIGNARIDVEENTHGRALVMRRSTDPYTLRTTGLRINHKKGRRIYHETENQR